ncbi:rna polymerase ii mediator complex component [Moniliophthora roreri]|nr:rna polymerase ii mediator complex component [Moniliophthora roreri]
MKELRIYAPGTPPIDTCLLQHYQAMISDAGPNLSVRKLDIEQQPSIFCWDTPSLFFVLFFNRQSSSM